MTGDTLQGIVSVLVALGVLTAVARQYFRLERLLERVGELETSMKDLDKTYLRNDLASKDFANIRETVNRIEQSVASMKNDLKESMHALRTDLLVVFKDKYSPGDR